jgi:hypothetical protein
MSRLLGRGGRSAIQGDLSEAGWASDKPLFRTSTPYPEVLHPTIELTVVLLLPANEHWIVNMMIRNASGKDVELGRMTEFTFHASWDAFPLQIQSFVLSSVSSIPVEIIQFSFHQSQYSYT